MVSSTLRPHFTPGKDPVPILKEAAWAPGPVWTDGISRPHRDSIPGPSSPYSVAISTELMMLIIPILLLLIRTSIFHLEFETNIVTLKTVTSIPYSRFYRT